jgi:hypothetical protein
MLEKRIICINVWIQLFISCLVRCKNRITIRRYASRSDTTYTTDRTQRIQTAVPKQYAYNVFFCDMAH